MHRVSFISWALSLPDRAVAHRQAEKITSEAMIALFKALEARHSTAPSIKVVFDNASYNRSEAVKVYTASEVCGIPLVFLPPYAPNLKLIDRLWWFLTKITLWNDHYASFSDFKAAIDRFVRELGSHHGRLNSSMTDRFRHIGAPKYQPP